MADDKRSPGQSQREAGTPARPLVAGARSTPSSTRRAPLAPSVEGRGRLIFALDATMSRQPTWDTRLPAPGGDVRGGRKVGGLDVQLVYFRGFNECRASRWVERRAGAPRPDDRDRLPRRQHADRQGPDPRAARNRQAEGERARLRRRRARGAIDGLAAKAGELGLLGLRVSSSRKAAIREVERGFREIARLSGGAYARFDANAAGELPQLLRAAAVYAAGGLKALAKSGGAERANAARADAIGRWPILFGGVAHPGRPDRARAGLRRDRSRGRWSAWSATASAWS